MGAAHASVPCMPELPSSWTGTTVAPPADPGKPAPELGAVGARTRRKGHE